MTRELLIDLKRISIDYETGSSALIRKSFYRAVSDFSLEVGRGETWSIVGESGSGKSTLAMAIMGLLDISEGKMSFWYSNKEIDISTKSRKRVKDKKFIWRHSSVVFQDPFSSIDPRMLILDVIIEPFLGHRLGSKDEAIERAKNLLPLVGLRQEHLGYYPDQLSGGLRQRVAIARSLIIEPDFVIFDEPTSSLDVSVQAQILNLIKTIRRKTNLTYIFITHNLLVARHISENVLIMYLGSVMEKGKTMDVFSDPLHPYTKLLMSSILLPESKSKLNEPPNIRTTSTSEGGRPNGCVFHNRCPEATPYCGWTSQEIIEMLSNDLYNRTGRRAFSAETEGISKFRVLDLGEKDQTILKEILTKNGSFFKSIRHDGDHSLIELFDSWTPRSILLDDDREVRCVLYDKEFSEYNKIKK
ncbi:MAG: ABC transporter ATP-binding protein [Candidatus Thermoplasmatota archaeon]|nr:ABC transporter ATP-binding protein [Candidatus Thermoplasmatota archaeon]